MKFIQSSNQINNMENHKIEDKVKNLEARILILERIIFNQSKSNPIGPKINKQLSAKEFLLSKHLSSSVDKSLALTYYLEHIQKTSPFNTKDLIDIFQQAREKPPTNINDMINKNISKGFLMETKKQKNSQKTWLLTASGENYVESKFSK